MKLSEIMNRAASAYPDEYILQYWDESRRCAVPCEGAGDSLAEFIAWELYETYDPEEADDEQINTAVEVMQNAVNELQGVVRALQTLAVRQAA